MELRDNNTRKLTSGLRRPFGVAGKPVSLSFRSQGHRSGPKGAAAGHCAGQFSYGGEITCPFSPVVSGAGAAQGAAEGCVPTRCLVFKWPPLLGAPGPYAQPGGQPGLGGVRPLDRAMEGPRSEFAASGQQPGGAWAPPPCLLCSVMRVGHLGRGRAWLPPPSELSGSREALPSRLRLSLISHPLGRVVALWCLAGRSSIEPRWPSC